jgi:hypothetical protein
MDRIRTERELCGGSEKKAKAVNRPEPTRIVEEKEDMGMVDWSDDSYDFNSSTSTTTTQYYTYTSPRTSKENVLINTEKKNATKKETVNKILQEIPIFAALYELGAFNTVCGMLISEEHWDRVYKMITRPEIGHILIYMVNTTREGLFFKNLSSGLGMILIYGLFDEGVPALNKANFIKKASTLLTKSGSLILLSDKEHPDNLKDIVAISGVEGKITEISINHIETRGLLLIKS